MILSGSFEIRLFAGSGFAPSYEETLAFAHGSACPKMPPHILGHARGKSAITGTTENCKKKVCGVKEAPRGLDAQTFALDAKNIIHGAQAKNL